MRPQHSAHGGVLAAVLLYLGLLHQTLACIVQAPAISSAQLADICASGPASRTAVCSLWQKCSDAALSPPIFPSLCNTTRLASTLCLDDAEFGVGAILACARWEDGAWSMLHVAMHAEPTPMRTSHRMQMMPRGALLFHWGQPSSFGPSACSRSQSMNLLAHCPLHSRTPF